MPLTWPCRKKRNRSFESISIGSALVILDCGLIAYVEEGPQALRLLHGYEVIVGLGLGIVLVSGTIVIKLAAQPENAGMTIFHREVGRRLSIYSVHQRPHKVSKVKYVYSTATSASPSPRSFSMRVSAPISSILASNTINSLKRNLNSIALLDSDEIAAAKLSFATSFRYQILVCLALACLSLPCCALMWQRHPRTFQDLNQTEDRTET
jgi:hypothetical protein